MVSAHIAPNTEPVTLEVRKPAREKKNWWQVGLTFVCWQIIAILFCELVLAFAGIGEEEIFKFDSVLGFRHFPNKTVTWRSEGFARSYFDDDGMREPGLTVVKPANTLRVALLGDSLVESLQVPVEKSFGKLIEKEIGPVNGKTVQVVNFGNSGYSTTQECLLLEQKVFRYKPDLVILGYSSRDMMENWSPPDETLSNVRPAALKLPGHELIIDNSPVVNWLNSPRARFLQSIEWVRHHSRVWGIISATELQLSMKDPLVKALLGFCTDPVRSTRVVIRSANANFKNFRNSFKNTNSGQAALPAPVLVAAPQRVVVDRPARNASVPAVISAASIHSNSKDSPVKVPSVVVAASVAPATTATPATPATPAAPSSPDPSERSQYTRLVSATMGGLIGRMNRDCLDHQAKFMVVGMPCRVDLVPYDGFQVAPELTFLDELAIIKNNCLSQGTAYFDAHSPAKSLAVGTKKTFFYSAHLAPAGHVYVSKTIMPAVRDALSSSK